MKTRSRRLGPLTLMSGALVMAVACSASASPSPSSPTGASPTPPAATEGPASPPVLTPSPGPSEASVPRWEAAGNSGEFLLSHAIALSSGRVVVLGEGPYSDGFQAPTSGQVWDPATGAWTAIDDLKHRSAFAAAALADDRVLVVGGLNDESPRQSYSSAHIYDARPGREGWTKTAIMATARTGPSAATLPGGRVLVAGGYFHAPEHGEAPDAVLAAYHPAEDDDEPSFDAPLFDADMGSGGAALATAEVFDPATDRWTTTGPMNYARYGAPAIALADGRVLIVGSLSASEGYVIQVDPRAFETGPHNEAFADAEARTSERTNGADSWAPPAGLPDIYIAMGQTAENVRLAEGVTREEMDEWGARSQQRAVAAQERGFFDREITPVTLADGTVVSKDDGPRAGTTVEKLAELKPVFRPDGQVTAGNACPLNDGAAAVVVMSDARAEQLGIQPLARIVSSGVTGLNPEIMGMGPVEACRMALQRAGLTIDDIDLVEINEAFAAQVIPSMKHLGIDPEKLNVNGGAIALGHPFGQTGARIMTTLLNGLEDSGGRYGLESMCVGGGQGMAMVVERVS